TSANELHSFRGHKDWISSVAFSRDSRTILSASVDKTIRSWEIPGGENSPTFGHERGVLAVPWSPDGKPVASAGGHDRSVRLWDTNTGKEKHGLLGHEDQVDTIAFSAHGNMRGSSGGDRRVKFW